MWSYSKQKALQVSLLGKVHEFDDVFVKKLVIYVAFNVKTFLLSIKKNGCLSCFICAQWKFLPETYELVVHVVVCRSYAWIF